MRSNRVVPAFIASVLAAIPTIAIAQDPPTQAPPADQLPPVDVIQKQPVPAPAAKKKSAAKKKQAPVSPAPQPPAAVAQPELDDAEPQFGIRCRWKRRCRGARLQWRDAADQSHAARPDQPAELLEFGDHRHQR